MSRLRPFARMCAGLACLGTILPTSALPAAVPTGGDWDNPPPNGRSVGEPSRITSVGDVELDPAGSLRGVVVNVQGVPIAQAEVVVRQADRQVARTETDAQGCFLADNLRGGIYEVAIGRYTRQFRTWAARTAPPNTKPFALIVVGVEPWRAELDVVRGQRTPGELFASDAVILTGLVGAMIAIPIAVHQSKRRGPTSP